MYILELKIFHYCTSEMSLRVKRQTRHAAYACCVMPPPAKMSLVQALAYIRGERSVARAHTVLDDRRTYITRLRTSSH